MELQELKNIWNTAGTGFAREFRIDYDHLKKMSLQKTRSLLIPMKLEAIFEAIINVLFLPLIFSYINTYLPEPKFLIPGVIILLMILFTIAWDIYSILFFTRIDMAKPIILIQEKIQRFKVHSLFIRQKLIVYIYPIAQTCMLIMFCKSVLNYDLYTNIKFLLLQLILGIAIVPFIIWIIKLSPDKKLNNAISFLEDIKKYDQSL